MIITHENRICLPFPVYKYGLAYYIQVILKNFKNLICSSKFFNFLKSVCVHTDCFKPTS